VHLLCRICYIRVPTEKTLWPSLPGIELGAVHQLAGVVHGQHVVDLGLGLASVQRVHVLDLQTVGQRLGLAGGGLLLGGMGQRHDGHRA